MKRRDPVGAVTVAMILAFCSALAAPVLFDKFSVGVAWTICCAYAAARLFPEKLDDY